MNFVEIKTDGFAALLPKIKELPIVDVYPIFNATDQIQQAMGTIKLLREQIAPELRPHFDKLSMKQIEELVLQWVELSTN